MSDQKKYKYDFNFINELALNNAFAILRRWLPIGRVEGEEYVCINPTRPDSSLGSFKFNVKTGVWADFATGDRGKGFISLTSYLFKLSNKESAKHLSRMLGIGG